ncbi:unnamed protein product [Moneuplotes crassus]|uniref:Protein-tyrosine-phosphatase n=1 Tax=Euplotes crassus TaxID=5936 RepID=A0AAD1XX18_EUPCR|nr:unnamed protein product [Moneuplotes crassus]
MDEITSGLFIGDAYSAMNYFNLQSKNVSHILSMAGEVENKFSDSFEYLHVRITDTVDEDILSFLPQAVRFIDKALTEGTGILVHCQQGISRSASAIIAYLMFKKRKPYKTILKRVCNKRPIVKPNSGFVQQLKEFEQKLLECDYDLDNIDITVEECKLEEVKHSEPDATPKDDFKYKLDKLTKTESNKPSGALDFLDNVKLDDHEDSHFKFAGIDDILK